MSSSTLEREWKPGDPCPCGCAVISMKLSPKTWHVRGCECATCAAKRRVRKGKRGQANVHRALGGVGMTPYHEESGKTYSVEVQVESKAGAQIPANLMSFARSEWARHAWSQAERAVPAGVVAFPSIYAEREGWQLLVTLLKEGRR